MRVNCVFETALPSLHNCVTLPSMKCLMYCDDIPLQQLTSMAKLSEIDNPDKYETSRRK